MAAKLKSGILAALLALLAVACAPASDAEHSSAQPAATDVGVYSAGKADKPLTLATADTGGMMYPVGCTVANMLNSNLEQLTITVETSAGSAANVVNLQAGQIDIALISGAVAFEAYNGVGSFDSAGCPDIRVIAACYPAFSCWITSSASDIEALPDLSGKKLAVGPAASATACMADLAIRASGLENTLLSNLGVSEGIYSVQSGENAAAHAFVGAGLDSMAEYLAVGEGRLLPYGEEQLEKIAESNPFIYKTSIPAGSYKGQKQAVPTFGVKNYICVNASMEKELAEELTKLLYQNREALAKQQPQLDAMLDQSFLCNDLAIPLHEGAERFYSSIDALK